MNEWEEICDYYRMLYGDQWQEYLRRDMGRALRKHLREKFVDDPIAQRVFAKMDAQEAQIGPAATGYVKLDNLFNRK